MHADELTAKALLDALPRAVVVCDVAGRIVAWSAQAERLYGWREADVLGHHVLDVLVPDAVREQHDTDLMAALLAGETFVGERQVVRRDGRPLHVYTAVAPIRGDGGEVVGIIGTTEDLSDRRDLERQARESTEHLQLALDAAGLGTFRWNRETGEVVWDERMEELYGFAPGSFDGTFERYVAALHPDDRARTLATIEEASRTGAPYRVEHRAVLPDGRERWIAGAGRPTVDADGVVTGAIGCSLDNTVVVQRRLEQEAAAAAALQAAEQERLHRERLELLAWVNEAIGQAATTQEVMAGIVRVLVPRLADWCSIHVLTEPTAKVPEVETYHVDPDMVAFAREVAERYPYDPDAATGVPAIIRTGEPQFYPEIDDAVLDEVGADDDARRIVDQLALRSALGVPLVKRGRVIGALQLVMTSSRRRYTDDDLTLAQAVASRVASAVENRRLAEQQHRIATTLQQSLLPGRLPAIPGIDAAVRYWAAGEGTEVGGDFYDLFPTAEDAWAAVVGDVCGTGPAAAALTSMARHSIRQSAWRHDDPGAIFGWLNRAMLEAGTDGFLTAAYLGLRHAAAGVEVEVTAAGHPLPVLVRRDGGSQFVGVPGTLVGVFEKVRVHPVVVTLEPGDALVLYTDGVSDVAPPHDLDDAGVLDLVAAAARDGGSAEGTAEAIHRALAAILPIDRRDDDIALLVLRATAP